MGLILCQEYEVVETMEVSREWLAKLGRFDTRLNSGSQEATEELKLDLRAIWTHRSKSEVQGLVQARNDATERCNGNQGRSARLGTKA